MYTELSSLGTWLAVCPTFVLTGPLFKNTVRRVADHVSKLYTFLFLNIRCGFCHKTMYKRRSTFDKFLLLLPPALVLVSHSECTSDHAIMTLAWEMC